jgi:hypothetical protein
VSIFGKAATLLLQFAIVSTFSALSLGFRKEFLSFLKLLDLLSIFLSPLPLSCFSISFSVIPSFELKPGSSVNGGKFGSVFCLFNLCL